MNALSLNGRPPRGAGQPSHSQITQPPPTVPIAAPSTTNLTSSPDAAFFVTLLKACETDKWADFLPPLPSWKHPHFRHISLFWSIVSKYCAPRYQAGLATRNWSEFIKIFEMLQPKLEAWVRAGRWASPEWLASVKGYLPQTLPHQFSRPRPPSQRVTRTLLTSETPSDLSTDNSSRKRKVFQDDNHGRGRADPIALDNNEPAARSPSKSYPSPASLDNEKRPRKMTKGNEGKALPSQSDDASRKGDSSVELKKAAVVSQGISVRVSNVEASKGQSARQVQSAATAHVALPPELADPKSLSVQKRPEASSARSSISLDSPIKNLATTQSAPPHIRHPANIPLARSSPQLRLPKAQKPRVQHKGVIPVIARHRVQQKRNHHQQVQSYFQHKQAPKRPSPLALHVINADSLSSPPPSPAPSPAFSPLPLTPSLDLESPQPSQHLAPDRSEMCQRDSVEEPSRGPLTPDSVVADHDTTCANHAHLDTTRPTSDSAAAPPISSQACDDNSEASTEAMPTDVSAVLLALLGSSSAFTDHDTTSVDRAHLEYPTPQTSDSLVSPPIFSEASDFNDIDSIEAALADATATPPGSNESVSAGDESVVVDPSFWTSPEWLEFERCEMQPKPRRGPLPCADTLYELSKPALDDVVPSLRTDDWAQVTSFPELGSLLLPHERTYYVHPSQIVGLPACRFNSRFPPLLLEVARQCALLVAFLFPALQISNEAELDRYWDLFGEFWMETRVLMDGWRGQRLAILRQTMQAIRERHQKYEKIFGSGYMRPDTLRKWQERTERERRYVEWMDVLLRAQGTSPSDNLIV